MEFAFAGQLIVPKLQKIRERWCGSI